MRRIQNDDPVETFFAHGTHPAFGIGVGTRGAYRSMDHLDSFRCKHGIEGGTVLAVVITYHMGELLLLRLQVPNDLARLLRHLSVGRMRRKAGQMNPAGSDFEEKEDIEGLQANGLDGEEIAR